MSKKPKKETPENATPQSEPVLSPLQPLQSVTSVRKVINKLISETLLESYGQVSEDVLDNSFPRVDISETDTTLTVSAEVPGLKKEDLRLDLSTTHLTITGVIGNSQEEAGETFFRYERYFGNFRRRVALPVDVSTKKMDVDMANGVLTVVMNKK
jgi:HSP20 family molecular chaperone IbpA